MTNTTVLILAAGKQERFNHTTRKHLLPINDEPLIVRTCRMANDKWGVTPYIVTDEHKEFTSIETDVPFGVVVPEACRVTSETLLSTSKLWRNTTIVLLGDVYYTDLALITIATKPQVFYGDNHEIFALKFHTKDILEIEMALEIAISDTEGKLWNAYRAFVGLPLHEHTEGYKQDYMFIYDETQDFDFYDDYELFVERKS